MQRPWIWLLIAAPMAVMIAFFAFQLAGDNSTRPRVAPVRVSGEADIGGPFTLVDHTGREVSEADFQGRAMLIYFGYTYCPDVCPFSLQVMAAALDTLDDVARDYYQPILITVDPQRDTVEHLAQYVTSPAFPDGLTGLTGSEEQVQAVSAAYRVVYQRAQADADDASATDYLMDHSSFIYLMDENGRFADVFGYGSDPQMVAQRLAEHFENAQQD
jgi:protein SCO1/2